jgi:hypothetical protein
MKNTHYSERLQALEPAAEPKVGIFWLLDGKLVIDWATLTPVVPSPN